MSTIVYVEPDGRRHEITGRDGDNAMDIAVDHDIERIVGDCGGNVMCATCHVYVAEGWADRLPPISNDEDAMLDATATPRDPARSRLSCCIVLSPALDGIELHLPEAQN